MYEELILQLSEVATLMAEDDTLAPAVAKRCRKLYNALLAEGFTEQQALTLTVANLSASNVNLSG